MTEGFEHLCQTHQAAGISTSNQPVAWGLSLASNAGATERVTVVYMITGAVDEHGRVLARRWGYEDSAGNRTPAPGLLATPHRVSRFDVIEGRAW